jgi:hypothetical protein
MSETISSAPRICPADHRFNSAGTSEDAQAHLTQKVRAMEVELLKWKDSTHRRVRDEGKSLTNHIKLLHTHARLEETVIVGETGVGKSSTENALLSLSEESNDDYFRNNSHPNSLRDTLDYILTILEDRDMWEGGMHNETIKEIVEKICKALDTGDMTDEERNAELATLFRTYGFTVDKPELGGKYYDIDGKLTMCIRRNPSRKVIMKFESCPRDECLMSKSSHEGVPDDRLINRLYSSSYEYVDILQLEQESLRLQAKAGESEESWDKYYRSRSYPSFLLPTYEDTTTSNSVTAKNMRFLKTSRYALVLVAKGPFQPSDEMGEGIPKIRIIVTPGRDILSDRIYIREIISRSLVGEASRQVQSTYVGAPSMVLGGGIMSDTVGFKDSNPDKQIEARAAFQSATKIVYLTTETSFPNQCLCLPSIAHTFLTKAPDDTDGENGSLKPRLLDLEKFKSMMTVLIAERKPYAFFSLAEEWRVAVEENNRPDIDEIRKKVVTLYHHSIYI